MRTSDHLARLWAADRIDALVHPASGAPPTRADEAQAIALASRYRLVTAVSGAVALDSQADTDDVGGGEPAWSGIPTVPEPETWALLAFVALLLAIAVRARRRPPAAGTLRAG